MITVGTRAPKRLLRALLRALHTLLALGTAAPNPLCH